MKFRNLRTHPEVRDDGEGEYTVWQVQKADGNLEGQWHAIASYETEAEAEDHVKAAHDARYKRVSGEEEAPKWWDKDDEPEEEAAEEAPEWTLKTSPEDYLKKSPDGPKADLAKQILGV